MFAKARGAVLVTALGALILSGDAARAASVSQSMAVNLTVANACTISTNPLAFGSYYPSIGGLNATTTVSVNCVTGTPWNVDGDGGANPSGASPNFTRRVSNGVASPNTGYVIYNIWRDAARTLLWGTMSTGTMIPGNGTGVAQILTLYATANGTNGTITTGNYTDTVNVSVVF